MPLNNHQNRDTKNQTPAVSIHAPDERYSCRKLNRANRRVNL